MNQNSKNTGTHHFDISRKIRSFAHSHVPKSANFASKNRLSPIRRLPKVQSTCFTTTCDDPHRKRTVPKFQIRLLAACFIIVSTFAASAESAPDADILLKDGTIFDGTGGQPYAGSVAIHDGRIIAVGQGADTAAAKQTIDCKGLIICPGFIDLHNHSDSTILKDSGRSARCYLTQGCTTLVTGNCGDGPTNIAKFYDDLDDKGTGINIATLVPQGSVREKIMGNDLRAPTPDELKKMQDLTDAGMQQGAWGISTGLQYVPGAFAKTDELIAVSQVVGKRGGFYASHIRDEGDTLLESIEEVIEIAKGAHLPVHVSHLKSSKKPNWGKVRAAAHLIEKAQRDGIKITADQYPYTASSTSIMAMLLPDEEREGGERATAKRLKDEATAKRLRPIITKGIDARGPIQLASIKSKPEWVGKIITDIAKTENREPVDVALDILRNDPEAAGVNFGMDEADVRFVMTLPWVATASDGSSKSANDSRPHPRSFGTFSRKIGRYSIQENVVPLPAAIRSATGLPADVLGMTDRGYLRKDTIADVAVIDPKTFEDRATYEEPFKQSVGVRWLFLAGKAAIADGEPQEVLAGKPLRRPPSTKAGSVK
jgi:N-acyl-D-amino-acid deacylase